MSRIIYKADSSPPARAAMMTAEILQVPDMELKDVQFFEFELFNENFLKLNPQHTVPILVDGDFSIWDSHAIVAYLVGSYASDDSLYPKDLKKRAVVDQRLHFDSGILFPALIHSIRAIVWDGATSYNPEGLVKTQKGYDFLETFLTGQQWVAGDSMTIADICCVATVSSSNDYAPIDPEKYPNITRWLEQFSKFEFYKKMNEPGRIELREMLKSRVV